MAWLLLAGAIAAEVSGTVALRATEGFHRLGPSVVVVVGYGLSFFLLSKTLRHLSLSITYGVWSAVGTAAIAVIGIVALGEPLTGLKVAGLLLVVLGVLALNLAGS